MKTPFTGSNEIGLPGMNNMRCRDQVPEGTVNEYIGRWGRMHKRYLESTHPQLYQQLISDGTLERHLRLANDRAVSMLEPLVAQLAHQEGITEQLKAEQPMAWVARMNSIRNRAEEIVMAEAINSL